MLVLSRKVDESIYISGQIKIKILKLKGNQVSVGIEAPDDVAIVRSELCNWLEHPCDNGTGCSPQTKSDLLLR